MDTSEFSGWTEYDYISLLQPESFSEHFFNVKLQPFQRSVIEHAQKNKGINVLCARQMGKTFTMEVFTPWYAIAHSNVNVLIFAPRYEQAVKILFARIRERLEKTPKLRGLIAKDPVTGKLRLGVDFVKFINGSSIRALSASDTANNRGWTGHLIIVDESQDVSDIVFYKTIMPMGAQTGANIIQIGTPLTRNHFYASTQDKENWKTLEFDWKNGTKKYKEEVKRMKKIMPVQDFQTEYELKWIDANAMAFKNKDIDSATEEYKIPYITNGDIFIGIDLARKTDTSIVIAVSIEGDSIVLVDMSKLEGSWDDQRKNLIRFLDRYNPKKVLIDGTGLGDVFLDWLKSEYNSSYVVEGYLMTQKNKELELYANLICLFESQRITIPFHYDLDQQLRELQKTITSNGNTRYHHPPRGHDDYPDALALAAFAAAPFAAKPSEPFVMGVDNSERNTSVYEVVINKDEVDIIGI